MSESELAEYMRRYNAGEAGVSQSAVEHKPKRTQPVRGQMNQTETQYSVLLDGLLRAGQIQAWRYEAITLKLAEGCRFTPDFLVARDGHPVSLHEVKRRWKNTKQRGPNFTGDARPKLLTAARLFPEFDFFLAWLDNGKWTIEAIEK